MLVAVCSLKGSPGVTSFAVALGACWPAGTRCALVECDSSGGDVASRFGLAWTPGLVSLAAAARHSSDPELVWRHGRPLRGGVPVVVAPPGAEQATAAVTMLAADSAGGVLRAAAGTPGVVVIADCGRVDPEGPSLPIVRGADVMLLLARAEADDLAHVAARLPGVGRWSRCPALLLVGGGYSAAEVRRELGVPVLCRIPDDPTAAAALRGQPRSRASRRRGWWGRSEPTLGQVAAGVAQLLDHRQSAAERPVPEWRPVPITLPDHDTDAAADAVPLDEVTLPASWPAADPRGRQSVSATGTAP